MVYLDLVSRSIATSVRASLDVAFGLGDGRFGTGSFAAGYTLDLGGAPFTSTQDGLLAIADFDGDSIEDVVTVEAGTGLIMALGGGQDGVGDGTFGPFVPIDARAINALKIAPIDNNVSVDIAAYDGSNIFILLNDGAGNFAESDSLNPGAYGFGLGDVTGDGLIDVVHTANATISTFPGDGSGSFGAAINSPSGFQSRVLSVNDFNLDGVADLATGQDCGGYYLLTGSATGTGVADGTFTAQGLRTGCTSVRSTKGVDFNGDGWPDFLAAQHANSNSPLPIFMRANDGSGGFPTEFSTPVARSTGEIIPADLDRDGIVDLVNVDRAFNTMVAFMGRGYSAVGASHVRIQAQGQAGAEVSFFHPNEVSLLDLDKAGAPVDRAWVSKQLFTIDRGGVQSDVRAAIIERFRPSGTLFPASFPYRYSGDRRWVRIADATTEYRFRIEERFGARLFPGSDDWERDGFSLVDNDATNQRGLLLNIPIRGDIDFTGANPADIRVYLGKTTGCGRMRFPRILRLAPWERIDCCLVSTTDRVPFVTSTKKPSFGRNWPRMTTEILQPVRTTAASASSPKFLGTGCLYRSSQIGSAFFKCSGCANRAPKLELEVRFDHVR